MEDIKISTQCYVSYLREMMEDLLNSPDSADVTIVTDDKREVKAHKSVLKASSGFFKSYLGSYSHQNQLVFLRGVNYEELNAILHFIYLGKAQVSSERIGHFIQVAKELEVKGIKDVEREKVRIENPNLYETVNCEIEYAKILSENFSKQDKETEKYSDTIEDDNSETIEDDNEYLQALTKEFESSNTHCNESDHEVNPDSVIQDLNKSFSEEENDVRLRDIWLRK